MSFKWSSLSTSCENGKVKQGAWTLEEDILLLRYIKLHGPGRWNALAKAAGLPRCGKSCRLRWVNYLRPDLKRGSITPQEERLISDLHARVGNRWSLIAEKIPGRTDNEIKNFWRSRIRKRQPLPSSQTSDGFEIVMSSLESNIPPLISMPNQTNLISNCRELHDISLNPAVCEASASSSMYQRSCEAPNNVHHYQVEEFVKWEHDELLSYSLCPWPEHDGLKAFMYQLQSGSHDNPSLPNKVITSLITNSSPKFDRPDSFRDLDVFGSLWNPFPLLHDPSQMMPQPLP